MNTNFNPDKIAQLLTQGTHELNADTLSALKRARLAALERQAAPEPAPVLALAHGWLHRLLPHSTAQWWMAALLAASLTVVASCYHHTRDQQIGELDVAILTDELPLEVFVD